MQGGTDRLRQEVSLAGATFSCSERVALTAGRKGAWVVVLDFTLPRGYNRSNSDLAIRLPEAYPDVPPDGFFLDGGLRFRGGGVPHYFESGPVLAFRMQPPLQNRRDDGWAWACLHIRQWRPAASVLRGDSLVTVCHMASDALMRWAQ